jgi:hypothetical protein
MDEPVRGTTEDERWSIAVDQAVADRAVGVYLSLPRLLRQLPVAIREVVRTEMEAFGLDTALPQVWYCVAFVRADDLPIGTWHVWQRADRPDVFWFCVTVSQTDYVTAIQRIQEFLTKQRDKSAFN